MIDALLREKLILIGRHIKSSDALPLAEAILAGGASFLELTFDQERPDTFEDTAEAIRILAQKLPALRVGAGTVMNTRQVDLAADAGARYIIAPNTNVRVIDQAHKRGLLAFPGAMTPSEIALAHEAGADAVKLFPAGSLGTGYLKALRGPMPHIRLIATGGIGTANASDFIKAGAAALGVGGSLLGADRISRGAWDEVTRDVIRLCEQVK